MSTLPRAPFSLELLVCHLCSLRETHTFQKHVSLRGRVCLSFFFCFPQQSYFKSVLPLLPPPGLFCLVLAHLGSALGGDGSWLGGLQGHADQAAPALGPSTCRSRVLLLCWLWKVQQGRGQSQEECLHPETQDHAAVQAGCYFRTSGTFPILCPGLQSIEVSGVTSPLCHKNYGEW